MDRRSFLKISSSLIASNALVSTKADADAKPSHDVRSPRGAIQNKRLSIDFTPDKHTLWRLHLSGTNSMQSFSSPKAQIDGKVVDLQPTSLKLISEPAKLSNGVIEYVAEGSPAASPYLILRAEFQLHPDASVVRFRYVICSTRPQILSKAEKQDDLVYFSTSFKDCHSACEVQFSQFLEQTHCYQLSELPITPKMWTPDMDVMGPAIIGQSDTASLLLAYEHGSEVPNAFLRYKLSPSKLVSLCAVKGNYLDGQMVDPEHPYTSLYMHASIVAGDVDQLASAYRTFILRYQSQNLAMRQPRIFYNTWRFQTMNKIKTSGGYLDSMVEERILKEIDVAHRLGIDTYVIDTGWYDKTGDWRVNPKRFSPHMEKVRIEIERRNMEFGLWFGPTTVAVSSSVAKQHPEWRMSKNGRRQPAAKVWETEESYKMCLVSDYSDAFADELIRLAKETGVRNIKWDAVDQYGCNDPHHSHGTEENSLEERSESYAFQLVQKMCAIADKVALAVPGTFVDFDVTERNRAMGLGFLASGKYSLMNSGPYVKNYEIPYKPGEGGVNVFRSQGQARSWVARSPLSFDRWLPSVLFLTHYLPDDPQQWQQVSVASLILGQNGLWGDILSISDAGVAYIGKTLAHYKSVRDDITESDPIVTGLISGSPEIHEKVSSTTGRGVVVIFSTRVGHFSYLTANKVSDPLSSENVRVSVEGHGRAKIEASFDKPGAAIIFFGSKLT